LKSPGTGIQPGVALPENICVVKFVLDNWTAQ